MIPLRDENPTKTFPFVTLAIIVINCAVFLYEMSLGDGLEEALYVYGAIPFDILHPVRPGVLTTLISSLFLHGGLLHLAGNMLYLWVFGNNVEDRMGHFRFIVFYLFCGVVASYGFILSAPDSVAPLIGASGAVSGVLGAYILLYPRAKVLTFIPIFYYVRIVKLPAVFFLGVWILFQVLNGAATLITSSPRDAGVAWLAHVVGFMAGIVLVHFFLKREEE